MGLLRSLGRRRLRRSPPRGEGLVRVGEAIINPAVHGLTGPRGWVKLTKTEWLVLQFLAANRSRVLWHEEIIEHVWGPEYRDAHHLLHDTVSRLRRRFLAAGLSRDPLETVHGVGYRLVEDR